VGGLVPGGTRAVKTAVMRGIAVAVITDVRGLDVDAGFEERDALGGPAAAVPLVCRALRE